MVSYFLGKWFRVLGIIWGNLGKFLSGNMEDAAGEVGNGGLIIGLGLFSLISTTTASDVRNVLATDAACSKQHLTTCVFQYIYIWQNGLNEKLEQDIIKVNLPWSDRWYQPTSDLRIDSLQRCNRTSCFRSIIPVDFRVKFHYKLGLVLPREMTLSNTFSMTILPFVPAFLAISLIG